MIKISAITAQLIHQSPFIAEALEDGLINVAALARKLQPEVSKVAGKPVQTGSRSGRFSAKFRTSAFGLGYWIIPSGIPVRWPNARPGFWRR